MTGQQLKNSILQLAIEGKLVPQDPNDEPASVLLERIKAERVSKNPSDKRHYENITENVPFEIPKSWVWVRLSLMCQLQNGQRIHGEQLPILDAKFLRGKSAGTITEEGVLISPKQKVILVDGENSGEVFTATQKGYMGSTFKILHIDANIFEPYMQLLLDFYKSLFRNNKKGAAIPHLNKDIFNNLVVSLPPLNEQKRIVAKIEELLPLVDEYSKAQEALDKLNAKLPDDLRKSILQQAIEGKLVPQDPNDEPASELLKRINPKLSTPCDNPHYENVPFEIPKSWVWVKLGDIGKWKSGSTPSKSNLDYYKNGNILWLTTGELNNGIVYDTKVKISQHALESCSLKLCKIGDVLIAMYGATIGKVAIAGREMTTNQACCACSLYYDYNLYLFWLLQAYKSYFIQMGEGGAQPNISKEKIINTIVPFPPLNEQKRIVSKIESLFETLDTIKSLVN